MLLTTLHTEPAFQSRFPSTPAPRERISNEAEGLQEVAVDHNAVNTHSENKLYQEKQGSNLPVILHPRMLEKTEHIHITGQPEPCRALLGHAPGPNSQPPLHAEAGPGPPRRSLPPDRLLAA